MRIGYFGGSFDPPHRAHLLAAELARQRFSLGRVLLAPTGRQPLKTGAEAPFADRLRMVELLCAGHPGLEASAIDGPLPGGGPNYTVDTLRRLRASLQEFPSLQESPRLQESSSLQEFPRLQGSPSLPHPAPTPALTTDATSGPELFAIVGADAFLGLGQWRDSAELLRLAQWVVVSRPGFALESESLRLTAAQRAAVHLLPGLDDRLSATELRRRLHAGEDCRTLIPPAVLAYLEARNLYRG